MKEKECISKKAANLLYQISGASDQDEFLEYVATELGLREFLYAM